MEQNTSERKFPYAKALEIAEQLVEKLRPFCSRITIAGSIRRKKGMVGDIELLVIENQPPALFPAHNVQHFRQMIADEPPPETFIDHVFLLKGQGVFDLRPSNKGTVVFGTQNKLLVHVPSGIPVDIFSTDADRWPVALVVRTGPKESNMMIAQEARRLGLRFNAYGCGFTNMKTGEVIPCRSEAEVFETIGLPLLPPEDRG